MRAEIIENKGAIYQIPLQQGLKPITSAAELLREDSYLPNSITTRIETFFHYGVSQEC